MLALLAVVLALAVAAGAGFLGWAYVSSPNGSRLAAHVEALERAHGAEAVPLPAISPLLRDAAIATEDERFRHEGGVDVLGLLRAIPFDVSHLSLAQGASTITEQLAKNAYLGGTDRSATGKAREIALGWKLGRRYGRSTILDDYLNTAYLGDGAWGAERASRDYFGRSADRLTLGQAALLAGLVQAPSDDDPRTHPQVARTRQLAVLASMVRTGYVTPARASAVAAAPLRIAGGPTLAGRAGVEFPRGTRFDTTTLAAGAAILLVALLALTLPGRLTRRMLWLPRTAGIVLALVALLLAARAIEVV